MIQRRYQILPILFFLLLNDTPFIHAGSGSSSSSDSGDGDDYVYQSDDGMGFFNFYDENDWSQSAIMATKCYTT